MANFRFVYKAPLVNMKMEERDVVERGTELRMKIGVTNYNTPFTHQLSKEYTICGAAVFQVKVMVSQVNNSNNNIYKNLIFIKFAKKMKDDELKYTIKLNSVDFGIADKMFTTDDGTWRLIYENRKQQYTFDLAINMDVVPYSGSFATLHGDEELTDFELQGEDGSVRVHRVVLAGCSVVLRRMLSGTWKETTEARVDIAGISKSTLQHFKDYVYLHKLPETGLIPLLLLASYYMMADLERKCVRKLVNLVTAENAADMLGFAAVHRNTMLLIAILERIQNGLVCVNDIRNHLFPGD